MSWNVLAPGTRIREYEIVQEIGRGGMGAVYRARHVYLRKERAIKVVQHFLGMRPAFTDRFIREARVLSELFHPNLVRLFEFGELEPGVQPGQTITIKGPPKGMGVLNVDATPRNCRISLDGEFVDVVSIKNLPVQAGSHTVQFNWEKMGKKLEKLVVLAQGQSETLMGTVKYADQ